MAIRWTFVDHGHEWPYVIISQCNVVCNKAASDALNASQWRNEQAEFLASVLEPIVAGFEFNPLQEPIKDQFEKFVAWSVKDGLFAYDVLYTDRRLGIDNGMDTVIHLDNHPP